MKERMLAGLEYRADDPELHHDGRRAADLTRRFNDEPEPDVRSALLAELLGSVGEGTTVRPSLRCDYGYNVHLGAHTFINWGVVLLDVGRITVGDHVQVGPGVQLLTATHPLDAARRRDGWEGSAPVAVGDGAWLGGGVVVLPGVSIGADAVVGAGSVVTRDVPAGVLVVGNPARVVRELA
ncbi:sugar O-acetyltransferase [Rhodococcus aerolatus]